MEEKRLKILLIPAWYDKSNPQTGSFFHEFAQALGRVHEVTLLKAEYYSFSQSIPKDKEDASKNRTFHYEEFFFKNKIPLKVSNSAVKIERKRMFKKALKFIDQIQKKNGAFDVVHLLSACHMITPLIADEIARKNNIPLVITEHFSGFNRMSNDFYQPFATMEEVKSIVSKSSLRLAVSEGSAAIYQEFFGCSFQKCHNLIPNHFVPEILSLPNTKSFEFLMIGYLNENKGQLRVIAAFKELVSKYPKSEISLKIIGKGQLKKDIEGFISSNKLQKRVSLIDEVSREDIVKCFDHCHVLISASLIETFGLTIVEAMFRGRPSIATKSGGPNEIINESNGILIDPGDLLQLIGAMEEMFLNYKQFNASEISQKAVELYSENAILQSMNAYYEKVIVSFKNA